MKTLITILLFGASFLTMKAQIASTNNSDLSLIDSSSEVMVENKILVERKTIISVNQLSAKISESLTKNDLLRKNRQSCSLVLELMVDEGGIIDNFKVSESNSKLMSQIVLHFMESADTLVLDAGKFKGISKIKIPFRYNL